MLLAILHIWLLLVNSIFLEMFSFFCISKWFLLFFFSLLNLISSELNWSCCVFVQTVSERWLSALCMLLLTYCYKILIPLSLLIDHVLWNFPYAVANSDFCLCVPVAHKQTIQYAFPSPPLVFSLFFVTMEQLHLELVRTWVKLKFRPIKLVKDEEKNVWGSRRDVRYLYAIWTQKSNC